jgi:hypothetical protein
MAEVACMPERCLHVDGPLSTVEERTTGPTWRGAPTSLVWRKPHTYNGVRFRYLYLVQRPIRVRLEYLYYKKSCHCIISLFGKYVCGNATSTGSILRIRVTD